LACLWQSPPHLACRAEIQQLPGSTLYANECRHILSCSVRPSQKYRAKVLYYAKNRAEKGDPPKMKDANWLKSQFAFPLVPTNMEGVYTLPPLPDSLNLKTASDATLLQHGLSLRRPRPGDHPVAVAAWNRVCERGLRVITPQLGPLPRATRRVRKRPIPRTGGSGGGGPITVEGQGGCALFSDASSGSWNSVTGFLTLPYLWAPSSGSLQDDTLYYSFWVGLDGEGIVFPNSPQTLASLGTLLQAIIYLEFDVTTNSAVFSPPPAWQWYVPTAFDAAGMPTEDTDEYGGYVLNPPPMKSGDLVEIGCGYLPAHDGTIWGTVYLVFFNDTVVEVQPEPVSRKGPPRLVNTPVFMGFFFPGPPAMIPGAGGSVEWIMENQVYTEGEPTTIMPVFSGSQSSITPVTFTYATGYSTDGGVTGDAADGNAFNCTNPAVSVTLAPQTVSLLYTGP